jgi:YVTN family beta-propeller protein
MRHPRLRLPTPYILLPTLFALLLIAAGMTLLIGEQARAQAEPTPLPLFALPDARIEPAFNSNSMALANDGQTVLVVNPFNNTLSFTRPLQGLPPDAEIPVGLDPRSVALTTDDLRAVVTNRADGTISLIDVPARAVSTTIAVGTYPYGVVIPDTRTAYIAVQGMDQVVIVDLDAGTVTARIATPALPTGLALWGDFLYVTHLWSGQISMIYLPQLQVVRTLSTGIDTGLSQSIELDVSRGLAYLPQTRSNARDINLTFDSTVFPVVNVLNLNTLTVNRPARISLDTADRPVNMPFATALDRFQQRLYVINAGSNDVSVIDLNTGLARGRVEVGANPRGALLNRDNSFLFVHNAIDGTITIIETRTLRVQDVLPISEYTIPADVLLGAELFHSADDERLTNNRAISCANCHFDGLSDGRVWQEFGGRNTPALFDMVSTPPYNWEGTWDELADVELKIRALQAGDGLVEGDANPALGEAHSGLSLDLDTLVIYLQTLQAPPSPYQSDAALIARGAEVFAEQDCASCHVGTVGTDLQLHDVDTGGAFDTPTLRWLWGSAPYLHDGRAPTLRDVFLIPGAHQLVYNVPGEDIDALVAYLNSLPAS